MPNRVVLLDSRGYTPKQMREYALKAIEAYEQEKQNEKVNSPSVIVEHGWVRNRQPPGTRHGQAAPADES
jgi:hypothetical protein